MELLGEYVSSGSGVGISVIRPGALYGPRDNFDLKTSHVIAGLIRRAILGETPFVVWGDGNDVRDILHVRDFARGCLLAMEHKADCDPVNIGAGVGVSTGELASFILAAAGRGEERPVFDPKRPTALPYRVLDCGKAETAIGFSPRISLADGLAETVAWCRAAYGNQAQ
jgi:GDP-L-fucose synthase